MNAIDNSVEIGYILETFFEDYIGKKEEYFWHIQLMIRYKDNPELVHALNKNKGNTNKPFMEIFVHSPEQLKNQMPFIRRICDSVGARAYMNIAPKSYKKVAKEAMHKTTDAILTENWRAARRAYWSATGSSTGEKKVFIVDIDDKNSNIPYRLMKEWNDRWIDCLETKNGYHVLLKPCNIKELSDEFPGLDIHKNNPTILYIPEFN